MSSTTPPTVSKTVLWIGWVISALPVVMLLMSAMMKFLKAEAVIKSFDHLGYSPDLALLLGTVELVCTALYVIPQTSVLGAILLTGYLGGAVATHVRIGESLEVIGPFAFGVFVWLGLLLRERRLRGLLPLRR